MRQVVFRLLALALGLAMLVIPLEIVFRFLPVADATRRMPVSEQDPVLHFSPNRDYTYSTGWDLHRVIRHRINNAGYFNPLEYDEAAEGPLLAFVGDSYIEAMMVPFEDTCAGRMRERLGEATRVYTFAVSGAQLPQYLAMARLARDRYRPDRLVVTIIGNDFDESLARYNEGPGYHVFEEGEDGELYLHRKDSVPKWSKRFARESAVIRYALLNVQIGTLPQRLRSLFDETTESERYVGNSDAKVTPERLRDSKRAVDRFLSDLPSFSGLKPEEILFVVDAARPQLYMPEHRTFAQQSYFGQMRLHFIENARAQGFEVADLQLRMSERFATNGERFEFADDGHWNATGHEVCYEAVAGSRTLSGLGASMGDSRSRQSAQPSGRVPLIATRPKRWRTE